LVAGDFFTGAFVAGVLVTGDFLTGAFATGVVFGGILTNVNVEVQRQTQLPVTTDYPTSAQVTVEIKMDAPLVHRGPRSRAVG
jgi:hypothetical protein